jgi:hypothetical protein
MSSFKLTYYTLLNLLRRTEGTGMGNSGAPLLDCCLTIFSD